MKTAGGLSVPNPCGRISGRPYTGPTPIELQDETVALPVFSHPRHRCHESLTGGQLIVVSRKAVLTPVFAGVLLVDERLSARGAVGLLVGLLGVWPVVNPDPAMLTGGGAGKLLLFAGAVSGALGSVLSIGASESVTAIQWGVPALLALGYVGIFAGAVAYVAYFGLIDVAGATHANLVFYVVPVVSTLGGWALLGETVAPSAGARFLVVFLGFAILGSESLSLPFSTPWEPKRPGRLKTE